MRNFPVTVCYWALTLRLLATDGSSAADLAWLQVRHGHQLIRPDGRHVQGRAYDTPMASLERQLEQLKAKRAHGPDVDEVVLSTEFGTEGEGGETATVTDAPAQKTLATTTSWPGGKGVETPAAEQDSEETPTPGSSRPCCALEAAPATGDLARQVVNYASARAVDHVILLLQRAASIPDKWTRVRRLLRELDEELEGFHDGNNKVVTSTPSMQNGELMLPRKHEWRNKMKKHKEKGVKKKPRHKEKVKIKASAPTGNYQRQEESNVLDASENVFRGRNQKNEVPARREDGDFVKNIRADRTSSLAGAPKNLSLEKLLETLLASSNNSSRARIKPRHREGTDMEGVRSTNVSPLDTHRKDENDVIEPEFREALQKVSFVKHKKPGLALYDHELREELLEGLDKRLQTLRSLVEEEKYLRNFHIGSKDWRSRPSDDDWPSFKSLYRKNASRMYHNGEEGLMLNDWMAHHPSFHPGHGEALSRGVGGADRAVTTGGGAERLEAASRRPADVEGQAETTSTRPGGGAEGPTTAIPATARHSGGGGSQRRRLFAYHRVTASPRVHAPPHSAYVAVSVVSPTAPVRRRASPRTTSTTQEDDYLEEELLRLVARRGQKLYENLPKSRSQ